MKKFPWSFTGDSLSLIYAQETPPPSRRVALETRYKVIGNQRAVSEKMFDEPEVWWEGITMHVHASVNENSVKTNSVNPGWVGPV